MFRHLIKDATNILAIRAKQPNAPIPTGQPYATVDITIFSGQGWDAEVLSNREVIDIDETICGRRNGTASINFFKAPDDFDRTASDVAEQFRTYLHTSKATEEMNEIHVALVRPGEVLDLTEIEVNSFESRAQIDIEFNVAAELTTELSEIQEVTITGDVEGSLDGISLTIPAN
jgi:hypothetical protein